MTPLVLNRHDGIMVVRDDVIVGGTKARVLPIWLPSGEEFVYASPAYGFAQVALAVSCRDMGRRCTIFTAKRGRLHPRTRQAKDAGATIVMVPTGYLSNVQSKARAYCEATGATLVPFGLNDGRFIEMLAAVAAQITYKPSEIWCVAGSGVLTQALRMAFPEVLINAVQIGKLPSLPPGCKTWIAPEKFEETATLNPPFPSCSNYDAKAWRFIRLHARPRAMFWNVAADT